MQTQDRLSPHDPRDLRVWRYRANSECPGGIEKVFFPSPAHVPEGGGWMDAPEKVEAKPKRQVWRYRANNLWPDGIERPCLSPLRTFRPAAAGSIRSKK
jgi:hypothetical protein